MPNTITAYTSFTPGTKARSNEVNNNFSNHRGDNIPINSDTATASDDAHDLGTTEHRWRGVYTRFIDFRSATSTVSLQIQGVTTATLGAMNFLISSVTVAAFDPGGFVGPYKSGSIDTSTAFASGVLPSIHFRDLDANGSFTVPSGITRLGIIGWGGGGGGGGGLGNGSSGRGGNGGYGAVPQICFVSIAAGSVFSITVGGAGNAGGATTTGNSASSGGTGGTTEVSCAAASIHLEYSGAPGGYGATTTGTTSGSSSWRPSGSYVTGGRGGDTAASGTDGGICNWGLNAGSGGGNQGAGSGGGGGGGGSSIGKGGDGGSGSTSSPSDGQAGTRGSGGGGGSGRQTAGTPGNGGAGGSGGVRFFWVGSSSTTL